ncbi:MAG: hypothetical protein PVI30_06850, partial [Myxococcales bacterium]
MPSAIAPLALLLGPLALGAAALVAALDRGVAPARTLAAARLASLATLVAAVLAATLLAATGPLDGPLLGFGELGLRTRLDLLSVIMFALIAGIGAVVLRFSRNYLDGDRRHGEFVGRLCFTLAAVLLLVTAGNLFQLALAWVV